jgi:hypothetical protein
MFLIVLMGFAAMAIDVGSWYAEKRKLGAAADAAALAGASNLPAGFAVAQSSANTYFTKNKQPGWSATITQTTTYAADDSVKVVATGTAQSFFAKLFGKQFVNIRSQATASIRTVTSYASTGDVVPLAVMKGSYVPGQTYSLYGDGSSSNNGAVSLETGPPACAASHGANDWEDTFSGALIACEITIGDDLPTKPGLSAGKIASGVNTRLPSGTWKPLNQIATAVGNGQYEIIDSTSPQIVTIPVVTYNGSTTWPAGNKDMTVVGFASFVITGCGSPAHTGPCSNTDAKNLSGVFINVINATTVGSTGAWDPQNGTMTHVQLSA